MKNKDGVDVFCVCCGERGSNMEIPVLKLHICPRLKQFSVSWVAKRAGLGGRGGLYTNISFSTHIFPNVKNLLIEQIYTQT